MKTGIHPDYFQTTVKCACGNVVEVGSTQKDIRIEICSKCHPFFTGEQRIVDTAGQVDRFMKRLKSFSSHQEDAEKRSVQQQKKAEQRFLKQQLVALDLNDRVFQILHDNNIITVGDLAKKLDAGKDDLLALEGFGEKAVEEVEAKLQTARESFFAQV